MVPILSRLHFETLFLPLSRKETRHMDDSFTALQPSSHLSYLLLESLM